MVFSCMLYKMYMVFGATFIISIYCHRDVVLQKYKLLAIPKVKDA